MMVPLVSSPCRRNSFASSTEGTPRGSHMVSLSSPLLKSAFFGSPNVSSNGLLLPFGGFPPESKELELNHLWQNSAEFTKHKQPKNNCQEKSPNPRQRVRFTDASPPKRTTTAGNKGISSEFADGCEDLRNKSQMNGSDDDPRMTGSSNTRADQLNWLADVATGAARAPQNSSSPTVESGGGAGGADKVRPPHLQGGADSVVGRNAFGSVLFGVSPLNQRMYSSQYHLENLQPSSPTVGSGISLYYSQAPRSAPYTGYYQTDPRFQYCTAIPDGLVSPRLPRPYFQGAEMYATQMATNVQLQNARVQQLPHSPSYHQQQQVSSLSPAGSPSSPHARLATNLMQNRNPDEMGHSDKIGLSVGVARGSPHFQHPDDPKRSPYAPVESATHSPAGERHSSSTSPYLSSDKESPMRQNPGPSSPLTIPYKVPTGKEGSLKHRILRPPSINIVDPPPAVHDAPLSAPPIRSSSHRELSPKPPRPDGYIGYRSFSTSSFVVDSPSGQSPFNSPYGVPTCALPSTTSLAPVIGGVTYPQNKRDTVPSSSSSHMKYPPAFMKGSIIQLANSQFKPVEHMTTEDFLECEAVSPNLKIDSSTVISIEKMPASGSGKLSFLVGEKKFQIAVEAPLEHPFFVYKQGWSSCCPERSLHRYGLNCHKLKVGDTCIFLTVKSDPAPTSSSSSNRVSVQSPKPPTLVPAAVASSPASTSADSKQHRSETDTSNNGLSTTTVSSDSTSTVKTEASSALQQPKASPSANLLLSVDNNNNNSNSDGTTPPPSKRKRRWSFPDKLSTSTSPPSSDNNNKN